MGGLRGLEPPPILILCIIYAYAKECGSPQSKRGGVYIHETMDAGRSTKKNLCVAGAISKESGFWTRATITAAGEQMIINECNTLKTVSINFAA